METGNKKAEESLICFGVTMECAQEMGRPPRPPPILNNGQRATTTDTYNEVKTLHDEAYKYIEDGLLLDEQGHLAQAVNCYRKGLAEIEKALNISSDSDSISASQKETVRKIHSKMTKSKLQIESRLESLVASPGGGGLMANGESSQAACAMDYAEEQPPSYDEAMSTAQRSSFMDLGDSIFSEDSALANSELTANATEIYSIPEGVQVFYITPEGYVSAPSYPSALRVYKFEGETTDNNNQHRPPAFLQVGDWYYPLVPGLSPALHASYGAYIFPDVGNPYAGSTVGLILPAEVSPEERQNFEGLMTSLTVLREQDQSISASDIGEVEDSHEVTKSGGTTQVQEQDRVASKIGRGILVAAEWVSWGVNKGAEKAGEMIRRGSTQLQSKINPVDKPREIPEKYQRGVEKVRKATHTAVSVSGYVVSKLGQATAALGRKMAPHVRKQGERFLPRSLSQKKKDGHSTFDNIAEVAASGLHAFGTVYVGLETAAKSLARSLANETVQVVNHKYGAEAAKFADNTIYSTGNLAMTGYNVNHLGVKAIAKRAAKDAGKAVLVDYQEKKGENMEKGTAEQRSEKPSTTEKPNPHSSDEKK